jgi:hypothetical protein
MVISLFMIAFMIMLVVDYFVFPRFNLEFEYTYFTGSLDIDKIMNMQARVPMRSMILHTGKMPSSMQFWKIPTSTISPPLFRAMCGS